MPEQPGITRTLVMPRPPDMALHQFTQNTFLIEANRLAQDVLKLHRFLSDRRSYYDGSYDDIARRLNEVTAITSIYFFQNNVAANQSAVALSNGMSTRGYAAQLAGSIVAVTVKSDAARTNGTLTITPTINGSAGSITAVLDGTNTITTFTQQDGGTDVFAAGDNLGCTITTTATWAPTTANIDCCLGIIYTGKFT